MEDILQGLSAAEVAERVKNGLINGDQNVKTKSVWQIVRGNAFTFFNILFVIFAVIMGFLVERNGKFEISDISNFGFLNVITINLVIGLAQELKAKRTIDKLSLLSAPKVTALRDGKEVEIPLKDIVMDEIILLTAGRQICADSVVVGGHIEVNESQITGEPDAIPKAVGDELLSGSYVVSGSAYVKVIRIGKDNYAAKISAGAKYLKAPNSEIHRSLTRFIKLMSIIIVPFGAALFCVKYFAQGGELFNTARTVLGSLIGMIPSGLMMLTSAVFCVSVVRLSRHKTLAQDLYCTETLARVDVLCLDKTGTLTEGKMEVAEIIAKGITEDELKDLISETVLAIGDENPTAEAMRAYAGDYMPKKTVTKTVPFSSARKWSAAELDGVSYVIGAKELVLADCDAALNTELEAYATEGKRVLVVARCNSIDDEYNFVSAPELIGLVLITDKLRKEARDTLRYFAEQGVAIKIISGDNPVTVKSIAERAGLTGAENYVDATTLKDEDLVAAVDKYTVFGRVMPDQKLKLIKALKAQGHTVAMTGDGVNDVLALREADCSVAMAAGSDAAKNVSQLILLDNNFASMPKVVAEGRRTINNLERSASLYLVKTGYNFLIALIFMMLNSKLPFEPKHLTLIGMVTIGIPSYVLALEPNKELVTGKFFPKVLSNALPGSFAVALSVMAITLFSRLLPSINGTQLSTICLIVTTLIGLAYIFKISLPLNKLRIALLLAMAGLFVAAFFADFGFFDMPEFFGLTTEFTKDVVILLVPSAMLSLPLFIGMIYITKLLNRKNLVEKALVKLKIA